MDSIIAWTTSIILAAFYKNNPEKLQSLSLQLIDYYLREINLGTWTFMKTNGDIARIFPQRDEALGHPKARALYDEKFKLMSAVYKIIALLKPEFISVAIEHRTTRLDAYYRQAIRTQQQFYTLDESDDSDEEDEILLKSAKDTPRKHRLHARERFLADPEMWIRTKRTTVQSKGLVDKLPPIIANPADIEINLKAVQDLLKQNHQKRAALDKFDATDGRVEFVALYRGNNYMSDRWTTPARREHYRTDERYRPQFSEAALKAGLDADFYSQLSPQSNPYRNPSLMHKLTEVSEQIRVSYSRLYKQQHTVKQTVSPSKVTPYVFNHYADWMQHEFSNGINRHLLSIKKRLSHRFWKESFVNAFNYALATGNRPYHSLKYALGAKEYYPYSFPLRYNPDGSLLNCHAGKIYIILIPKSTFLKQNYINRVVPKNYTGQLPIGLRILPELETSFIGAIPGEQIVHQEELKFPSFNKRWQDVKRVYAIKYGFNETLYNQFQTLIKTTHISTNERAAVLNLLKEWLCAFHEVMLLKLAEQHAAAHGGRLVYVDHENESVHLPDKNPKTSGELNADQRNRVNLLERLRSLIAIEIKDTRPRPAIIAYVTTRLADRHFLDLLRYETAVTTNEDARRLLDNWQDTFKLPNEAEFITPAIVNPENIYLPSIPYSDRHIIFLLKHYSQHLPACIVEHFGLPFVACEFLERINKAVEIVLGDNRKKIIVPISSSQQQIELWHYNDATWLGIIISFSTGRLQLQIHNPGQDFDSYVGDLEDFPQELNAPIVTLLQQIRVPGDIQTRLLYYPKQQEAGLDSGAWLVDSLIQLILDKPAPNLTQVSTQAIRNKHYRVIIANDG